LLSNDDLFQSHKLRDSGSLFAVSIASTTVYCPIMNHSFSCLLRNSKFLLTAGCRLLAFAAQSALAQTYPTKPVRVLAGFGSAGGSDAMLRQVSTLMAGSLGQALNVENKPGAGSLQMLSEGLGAPADGHTLMAVDNGVLVYNAALYKKLPYDPAALAPIGTLARAPLMLVTHPGAGFKHVRDMLEKAKGPTKLTYASPSVGNPMHVAMEMLKNRAGVPLVRIPFGSDAAALKDVLAGQVDLAAVDLPSALPHIRSGKLQVLATFSGKRMNAAPDAPAVSELGFKDAEAYVWQSFAVPAATPKDVQAKLTASMQAAMSNTGLRRSLTEAGWEILASDAGLMSAYVAADTRVWHKLIKEAGISAD
jgi:tripartite-type tricarboxylate transporter receptor subunit TctC